MGWKVVPPNEQHVCNMLDKLIDDNDRPKLMEEMAKLWQPGRPQSTDSTTGLPTVEASGSMSLKSEVLPNGDSKFTLTISDPPYPSKQVTETFGPADTSGRRERKSSTCEIPTS